MEVVKTVRGGCVCVCVTACWERVHAYQPVRVRMLCVSGQHDEATSLSSASEVEG